MRRRKLLGLFCLILKLADAHAAPLDSAREALLEVTVNGEKVSDASLVQVTLQGEPWARRSDLQSWGIRLANDSPLAALDSNALIRLDDVPGVHTQIDSAQSRLAVDVQPALLETHEFANKPIAPQVMSSPWGVFVNYDLGVAESTGPTRFQANVESGVVHDNWVARSTWLESQSQQGNAPVRLDSNITMDSAAARTSLQAGDTFARLGINSESVRIGGFAWGTDFSVTPTFVTVPLPTISNLTAAAGVVDLYVNGAKTQQLNVPGGPFVIAQVPVTTGAGQITIVTRDLLGHSQTITQGYYVAPQMLQAGLSAWDVQFGAKREQYGASSDDYGGWLAAAGQRFGVSDRLTTQWRIEADEGGAGVGAQGLMLTPGNALVTLGPYCSAVAQGLGCQLSAAYERDLRTYGYGIDLSYATSQFAPVAAADRAQPPHWQVFPHVQATTVYEMSFTLGGTWRDDPSGQHNLSLNLSAAKTFAGWGHLDLMISRTRGFNTSSYISLIYTQSIGSDKSLSATTYGSDGRVGDAVSVQRNLPLGEGYGYSARVAHDSTTDAQASVQWNGDTVTVAAVGERQGDHSTSSADVSGAFLWMDSAVLSARHLDRGFAVIDAHGLPGVPVFLNEQRVTVTDAQGLAVLPDLRSFEANTVALDPATIPLNLDVSRYRFEVTPYRRGGAVVTVDAQFAASVVLRQGDGSPVPSGARVHDRDGNTSAVGRDGLAYLRGVSGTNRFDIEWPQGHCDAHLQFPVSPNALLSDDTVEVVCGAY